MKYETIIHEVALKLINEYKLNEKVYSGVNGPYDDPESIARNLAHLIIITCIEDKLNGGYIALINTMGEELQNLIEKNGLYVMRNKKGKDQCNGVIGHAWIIEAFVYLYIHLNNKKYLELAKNIADKHKFSEKHKLWYIPQETSNLQLDLTLNHQLWYAASLAELNQKLNDTRFENEIQLFLNNLPNICKNSLNGKIAHSIYVGDGIKGKIKSKIKRWIDISNEVMNRPSMSYKEQGYHVFNLMAFARIYLLFPDKHIYTSKFFKRAINYVNSDYYFKGLLSRCIDKDKSLHNEFISNDENNINVYGYPYNVPGFELMYINAVLGEKFGIKDSVVKRCFEEQVEVTYSSIDEYFTKTCHDKWAVNYRIYEYYRFLEIKHEKKI